MTLVNRMRAADYRSFGQVDALLHEAADRIEALEKAMNELLDASDIGDPNEFSAFEAEWNRAHALVAYQNPSFSPHEASE